MNTNQIPQIPCPTDGIDYVTIDGDCLKCGWDGAPRPVRIAKVATTAQAMCPKCGRRALVRGRYDDGEGDSRAWAYCNRCPYHYED